MEILTAHIAVDMKGFMSSKTGKRLNVQIAVKNSL